MARGDYDEELGKGCFVLLAMVIAMLCTLVACVANITKI